MLKSRTPAQMKTRAWALIQLSNNWILIWCDIYTDLLVLCGWIFAVSRYVLYIIIMQLIWMS
jgi:hypothetical protein